MIINRDKLPDQPTPRPEARSSTAIVNPEPVLDAYAEWFGQVMRQSFYPEDDRSRPPPHGPDKFAPWLEQIRHAQQSDPQTLTNLIDLHTEMRAMAEELVALSATGAKPPIEKFDHFVDLYDAFNLKMRRLGWDCLLSESGIDSLTGFRSLQVMFPDLDRELDRRNRQGRPFCMAYMKVDHFDALTQGMGHEAVLERIRRVSDIMKLCMRTYDDAYRYGPGEIVWSLKHSDITGGMRAIERLRRMIEDEELEVSVGGKSTYFTMSYIVAEPVPGDVLPEVLALMRGELAKYADEPDVVLRHKEVSRLQLYVGDSDDSPSGQIGAEPSARS
jgi:diguanylate cyclase